jgi:general secretion pathway protein G
MTTPDSRVARGRPRQRRRPHGLLLARSPAGQRGLTLIEVLIIMAVLGTLATIGLFLYSDMTEQTKIARAVPDIAIMCGEIDTFEIMNERLPNDLGEIKRASLVDPWGHPYVYRNFATTPQGQWRKDLNLVPLNSSFDLYSLGKDGLSLPPLTAAASRDDIVRANDGNFIGLASRY